jgi:excisionase family DNA binding protein
VPESNDFMTVAEVAAILKLNQQAVRNWIDQGKLPALHIRTASPHPAGGNRNLQGRFAAEAPQTVAPRRGPGVKWP